MARKSKYAISSDIRLCINEKSVLGEPWVSIYKIQVDFDASHFEAAMNNLIQQPNINSTVILRADILKRNIYNPSEGDTIFTSNLIKKKPEIMSENSQDEILHRYLDDVQIKKIALDNSELAFHRVSEFVRRIIPRNPFKDPIINQTCLVLSSYDDMKPEANRSVLVVYIPHIKTSDEVPFYLPPVYAVGLLYHNSTLSIEYFPFEQNVSNGPKPNLRSLDPAERPIRIALRLLQTAEKHSRGEKLGYEKKFHHDLVVPKIAFQNRYISLKKKYSAKILNLWCESTDPKKHVFEDLAIAAFLIELWHSKYKSKDEFEFRDLGCGNGLLVHILIQEGYRGKGIDARARKSWRTYPEEVQNNLLEQIIIPSVLLKPHPAMAKLAPELMDNGRVFHIPNIAQNTKHDDDKEANNLNSTAYYSSSSLLQSSQVCTTEDFPPNTFLIGNHSDELTCWVPLLGFPFVVIPCCSHALSGAKFRYPPKKRALLHNLQPQDSSTYGALVNHVEYLALSMGWNVQKEMLRIPSTRNAALIGTEISPPHQTETKQDFHTRILDLLALQGGADGWVENATALMKAAPRSH